MEENKNKECHNREPFSFLLIRAANVSFVAIKAGCRGGDAHQYIVIYMLYIEVQSAHLYLNFYIYIHIFILFLYFI